MVSPSPLRQRVGSALMAATEEWGRHESASYIALVTRRAGAFYTAIGYRDSPAF